VRLHCAVFGAPSSLASVSVGDDQVTESVMQRIAFGPAAENRHGFVVGSKVPSSMPREPHLFFMSGSVGAIVLVLLALSSCAPTGPDPGYAAGAAPIAPPSQRAPHMACTGAVLPAPCSSEVSAAAPVPGLYNAPAIGIVAPPSPSLVPVSSVSTAPTQASPPLLGSSVSGSSGALGTVVNQTGNTAVVAPIGGGAPGMMVPNGNGTATVFQPGGVPEVATSPMP
jgi:hypothetical protein